MPKGRRVSPPKEVHILISESVTMQGTDVVKNLEMEDCWGLSEPNIITKLLRRKAGGRVRERVKMTEARGQRKRLEDASLLAFLGGRRQGAPRSWRAKQWTVP